MSRLAVPVWLSLCVLTSAELTASGQEWTRFRGPNGTGLSDAPNIPVTWEEKDYHWKAKLPSGGHSSPVIWDDRIFLSGSSESDGAHRQVFAVNVSDGSIAWTKTYPLDKHPKHKLNSFASSTPVVDEDRVYVTWTTPQEYSVKALSHEGQELWSRNLGPFVSQHSGGVSPILFEDLLIVVNDQDLEGGGKSSLTALNRSTGETVWTLDRNSDVVTYSTPCEHMTPSGRIELIYNSKAHGISGLDPFTGKVLWEVNGLFDKRSVSSSVVASGNLLIGSCGSGGGGNYVVAVKPGTAEHPKSGELVYKVTKQAPYVPTPLALGDLLFLWSDNGIVSCLDAKTGQTHWQSRIGGTFYGSPVCVKDRLYCIDTNGDVVVLAAGPEFAQLGRTSLGEPSNATPAVAGGRMYLRTVNTLFSLGGPK